MRSPFDSAANVIMNCAWWAVSLLCCLVQVLASVGLAPEHGTSTSKAAPDSAALAITKTVKTTEIATDLIIPIECDDKGNIYLRTETDGFPAIHKISDEGVRVASFAANSCPDIKVQVASHFSVTPDGRVQQVVFPTDDTNRYILIFNSDGTCHSKLKLDPGFMFVPYQITTFPSGNMIIAGLRWSADKKVRAMWPYTALFNSSGTVLKEINLEDDVEIHKLGAQSDSRVVSPGDPNGNTAVARGVMEMGSDGNVSLMRRLSPAIIYVLSEGGSVVRHFSVDPGDADLMPSSMHVAGSRMAVLFRNVRTNRAILKVVTLDGKDVATYEEPLENGRPQLGMAFACYTTPPDKFIFLTTSDDNTLGLRTVEPH